MAIARLHSRRPTALTAAMTGSEMRSGQRRLGISLLELARREPQPYPPRTAPALGRPAFRARWLSRLDPSPSAISFADSVHCPTISVGLRVFDGQVAPRPPGIRPDAPSGRRGGIARAPPRSPLRMPTREPPTRTPHSVRPEPGRTAVQTSDIAAGSLPMNASRYAMRCPPLKPTRRAMPCL